MKTVSLRSLLAACALLAAVPVSGCSSQSAGSNTTPSKASVETTQSRLIALRSIPASAALEGPSAFSLVPVKEVGEILHIKGVVLGEPKTS